MKLSPKGRTLQERMLAAFGTTTNIRRTAYVLRDGSLVTYRGTGEANHAAMAAAAGADSITDFLCSTGAIRVHDWKRERTVHACAYRPTHAQRDALAKFLYVPLRELSPPNVIVDVSKGNERVNRWAGGCMWQGHERPNVSKVVRCIVEKGNVTSRSK
ncbi:MAG: hypothetical protein JSV86_17220 [Gemmatimonadota bacterium]|nr:MAG: hypothetical protein JSV86_17220 [Gemmatimonadota bacterium]